jgi:hypothetical protein
MVPPMCIIEVDVIRAQTTQAVLERLQRVVPRSPAVVGTVANR